MRRIKILFYWLLKSKNNVSLKELVQFLTKPQTANIALPFIEKLEKAERFNKVYLQNTPSPLYWPTSMPLPLLYQVIAETFDANDWHYYQKEHTRICSDDILLDIGAAEGLFSLTVAPHCKQLLLVEPNSTFEEALKQTFVLYKDKTTIYKTAVGNTIGVVNFDDNNLAGQINTHGGTAVPITTIDALIPETQPVTFLKADIEGFEYEMLLGAENTIKRNKPKIAITTYHDENNANDIIKLILQYVPSYHYMKNGIFEKGGKPVMVHFWH